MRPFEILLSIANVPTLILLAIPLPRTAQWIRYSAFIALLIAGVQILFEGPRWQMVPAYALAGLLCLAWLLQNNATANWPIGKTSRLVASLGIGLGVLGLVISIGLPMILPVFRFPHPTGPYEVGTLTYHWTDADRPEVFTTDPNDQRELMVQIWYPAKGVPSSPRAPYIQDSDVVGRGLARFLSLPGFTFGHWKYISSHAIPSASVADDQPSYPVLIFLEGLGGYRQMNSFQVEELVSYGYIIAAIDQPYSAAAVVFPDGRQVAYDRRFDPPYFQPDYDPHIDPPHGAFLDTHLSYLAQDVVFTLDQLTALNQADPNGLLTRRLDLQRAGLFGPSWCAGHQPADDRGRP